MREVIHYRLEQEPTRIPFVCSASELRTRYCTVYTTWLPKMISCIARSLKGIAVSGVS